MKYMPSILAALMVAIMNAPLAAQDPAPSEDTEAAPTLFERAQAIAAPAHWPTPESTADVSEETRAALTSDAALVVAAELLALPHRTHLEKAWLCWHFVAMDWDEWIANGAIDYQSELATDLEIKHRLYGTTEEEFYADAEEIGFDSFRGIAEVRGLAANDFMVNTWGGTALRSPRWAVFAASYAAELPLGEQMAFWRSELQGLLKLVDPPQAEIDRISTRLIALSILQRTEQ